jgi:hypothetical protein
MGGELVLDSDGRHIPGSGIDFQSVGGLHALPVLTVEPVDEHQTLLTGVPCHGPEQLIVARIAAAVGDVAVQLETSTQRAVLGRPMQVRAAGDGYAVLADDISLGEPREVHPLLGAGGTFLGGADVWVVLDMWGIARCPRCGGPALHDGGNAGPPEPGHYTSSCVGGMFAGTLLCARCGAQWTPDGGRSLTLDSEDWHADQPTTGVARIVLERGFDMTLNAELLYDSTSGVLHFGGRGYGSGFLLVTRAEDEGVDQLGRPYFDWRIVDGRGETMALGEEYVDLDGAAHPVELLARFIGDIVDRAEAYPDDDDALLPPGELFHPDDSWWVRHHVAPRLSEHLDSVAAVVEHLEVR